MRKINFYLFVFFIITYGTLAAETETLLAPPENKIDFLALNIDQWMEGDNLELAGDLSQYPLAQQAIKKMHPDLMNLDLSQGHTIYSNGEITNGITLNLKDKNLKGTIIKALGGGGFSIWKGSSDQGFSFEDNFFDLSEAQGPIEIRNANEFISISDFYRTLCFAQVKKIILKRKSLIRTSFPNRKSSAPQSFDNCSFKIFIFKI